MSNDKHKPPEAIAQMQSHSRQLASLMDDPEPEIASWWDCVNGVMNQIDALWYKDRRKDQKTIDALVTAITNARVSIAVMSMRQLGGNVASNEELLKIMDASFIAALALAKKGE